MPPNPSLLADPLHNLHGNPARKAVIPISQMSKLGKHLASPEVSVILGTLLQQFCPGPVGEDSAGGGALVPGTDIPQTLGREEGASSLGWTPGLTASAVRAEHPSLWPCVSSDVTWSFFLLFIPCTSQLGLAASLRCPHMARCAAGGHLHSPGGCP